MNKHTIKGRNLQEKQELYQRLRNFHGSIAEVIRRTRGLKPNGYTRKYILMVLNKEDVHNIDILNVCAEVASELEEKQAKAEARFEANMERLAVSHS
jgi:hypothetical protein